MVDVHNINMADTMHIIQELLQITFEQSGRCVDRQKLKGTMLEIYQCT